MNAYEGLPRISEVQARTAADDPLFAELSDVLAKHQALDRFGIVLLHTHFPMKDGEILSEEIDEAGRTQLIRPVGQFHGGHRNGLAARRRGYGDHALHLPDGPAGQSCRSAHFGWAQ